MQRLYEKEREDKRYDNITERSPGIQQLESFYVMKQLLVN
ncbi:MAG: hypothetical protein K0R09_234 [Clostridiales bacterium]|nr:hypothetical protein [Clostridiales bacterium]